MLPAVTQQKAPGGLSASHLPIPAGHLNFSQQAASDSTKAEYQGRKKNNPFTCKTPCLTDTVLFLLALEANKGYIKILYILAQH